MDSDWMVPFVADCFVGIRDLGRAKGVCVKWRSAIRILPAAQQLLRRIAVRANCQVDAWPCVDCSAHPREMFADSTKVLLWQIDKASRFDFGICQVDFFVAWGIVLRSLPIDKINEIHEDGTSLISCMLLLSIRTRSFVNLFDRLLPNVIQRKGLNLAVLKSTLTFGRNDFDVGPSLGGRAPTMWLCMRGKKGYRNGGRVYNGGMDILAKLPHDVLESCVLPSFILQGCRDNVLQHILEPVSQQHSGDKDRSEALFRQVVAQRFGLVEHIHRNREGICALSYAEQFVHNIQRWDDGSWARVRNIISAKMLEGCHDISARTDDESFLFLMYVVQELKGALESALSYMYEDLSERSHLRHVVASFESVQAKRVNNIRMQWLARGWKFAHSGEAEQIAEVLRHYALEAYPITSRGIELRNEERQEADWVQTVDAVTQHVVHDEPAATPNANDAAYRAARQRLIIDEEWAQRVQRQINEPGNAAHPTEGNPEQDGVRLHILEFSRAPKEFHDALVKDEDLSACTAALYQQGFAPIAPKAKIFVAPSDYLAALPHALGLQSRHVVASEHYVENVLAAVRGLKGKYKVHQKSENRREVVVGNEVEVAGLVNNRELNGHSGIVLRYVRSRARWAVRMIADGREILVLPKNLRLGDNELLVQNTFIHVPTRSVASLSIGARTY